MGNEIIGATGRWTPALEDGDPEVSFLTEAGNPSVWRFDGLDDPKDTSSQALTSDIRLGLVTRRKTDYVLKDLAFSRAYRNRWEQPMSFGIGTIHTLDIFLVGEMGSYIELIYTNGSRIHFDRDKSPAAANQQVYLPTYNPGERGFEKAVFDGDTWRLTTKDGWVYLFPYRPQAYRYRVTVLTGFTDPQGRQFDMVRNEAGDLQSLHTPSGQFLRFQYDSAHRIASIEDSDGRVLQYQYDQTGRLSRVSGSAGEGESYNYDSLGRMGEVRNLAGTLLLRNVYSADGYVAAQTLSDGRSFSYF
jgi:YD repeat-containing protein